MGAVRVGRDFSVGLRDREIVIDRTCARCGCEYEWGVHVAFFAERAALDPAQITSLTHGGAHDACWESRRDRLLIRLADALHDHGDLVGPLVEPAGGRTRRGSAPRSHYVERLVPRDQFHGPIRAGSARTRCSHLRRRGTTTGVRSLDIYELSVDLRPGVRDTDFVAALDSYLGLLQREGKIESWRLAATQARARERERVQGSRRDARSCAARCGVCRRVDPPGPDRERPSRGQLARHELRGRARIATSPTATALPGRSGSEASRTSGVGVAEADHLTVGELQPVAVAAEGRHDRHRRRRGAETQRASP